MTIQLKSDRYDLSVLIPAKDEAANLFRLLPAIKEALDEMDMSWELIVVDAHTDDGTEKVVQECGGRCIYEDTPGYGAAIQRGIAESQGEYILTLDADLSHPAEFIKNLWNARKSGGLIVASRYVPGAHAEQPWLRATLSRVLNSFFSRALMIPVKDMSSGFRLYRRNIFRGMDLEFKNFVVLVEILIKTFGNGIQIVEVPFHYAPRRTGNSHAQILRFGIDYLRLLFRVWRMRNSVMFADYDARAYDSRIPLQRYWQRKRHKIVLEFTPPYVSTADIGCGSSRILQDLPHAVGVDPLIRKLSYMKKTNTRLLLGDGCRLPFKDGEFECVICSQVIEHIPDGGAMAIDELTRVLADDGILVLGTPDYGGIAWNIIEPLYGLAAPHAYADEHVTHYTFKSLKEGLEGRGYEILDYAYICRAELIIKARKLPAAAQA